MTLSILSPISSLIIVKSITFYQKLFLRLFRWTTELKFYFRPYGFMYFNCLVSVAYWYCTLMDLLSVEILEFCLAIVYFCTLLFYLLMLYSINCRCVVSPQSIARSAESMTSKCVQSPHWQSSWLLSHCGARSGLPETLSVTSPWLTLQTACLCRKSQVKPECYIPG